MVLPSLPSERETPLVAEGIDVRRIAISVNEAVATLGKNLGRSPAVKSVVLKQISETPVYEITTNGDGSHLVDARSGNLFTVTPKLAGMIAERESGSGSRVRQVDILRHHNLNYPWGPLPVYRVVFEDSPSSVHYVSARDGTVQRISYWRAARRAMGLLHTFQPVRLLFQQDPLRKALLILTSLIGIVAVGTGFYLALRHAP